MKSIKGRLLSAFLTIISILSVAGLVFFLLNLNFVQQYRSISDIMIAEYRLVDSTAKLIDAFNVRVQSGGTDARVSEQQIQQAKSDIQELTIFLDGVTLDTESKANYLGFKASIEKLEQQIDESITRFEEGSIKDYFSDYQAADKYYGFVRTNGTALIFSQLKYTTAVRNEINRTYMLSISFGLAALVFVVIGCIIFVLRFANKLTKPLVSLTQASEQIAAGNMQLVIDPTIQKQQNELGTLAKSFTTMVKRLQEKIVQLNAAKENTEKEVVARTKELNDERTKLWASISSLSVGFIMTDRENNLVLINPTAKSIFTDAHPSQDTIDEPLTLKTVEDDLKNVVELRLLLEQTIKEKKPLMVKELAYANKYLKLFITPIIKDDVVIGCVILLDDITEAKILERSKDEFFSIASHELRTPLTAIRGNTSLMKEFFWDKLTDKKLQNMIDDIHNSSIRLIQIVNDFLNVSRLEQGRMEFKFENFDIVEVINKKIVEVGILAKEKSIPVSLEIGSPDKLQVYADKDRIGEVLLNLLGNAIKYTSQGGVTVKVHTSSTMAFVSVRDTGKGISEQQMNLLFRKFQQAGTDILTRDNSQSTGLGLYISKLIMQALHGEIYLEESKINEGSVFTFTVPLAKEG